MERDALHGDGGGNAVFEEGIYICVIDIFLKQSHNIKLILQDQLSHKKRCKRDPLGECMNVQHCSLLLLYCSF